jgi:hypothetical protein
MRKLLNWKIIEQDRKCAICHQEFTDYNDIVPDHRDPKGMGGRRGGMSTQTTSKPFIGGAIRKKAQPELRIKVLGFWIRFFQREFHERLSHNAA